MSTGGGSPSERATPASKRKHKSGGGTETSVGVYCRFRPENKREVGLAAEGGEAATFEYHPQQVVVRTDGEKKFNLDALFPPDTQQAEVYDAIARDMVESIVHGFNGTIFAYGQTGSGKSHSMMGPGDLVRRLSAGDVQSEAKGIIPRAVDHLFSLMTASPEAKFKVSVSYLEVYQEKISDLLVPDRKNTNLKLVERVASRKGQKGRFETVGLTRQHVTSAQEVVKCLSEGDACRTIRSTDMNAVSSRSHAVLEILVERENADGSRKEGTLNLVDLAGSEDSRKTGATGQGLKEAQKINQSLSALSGVIKALSEAKTHVPYRDSTLTKILMSSLGGNCRTSLLLAASPSFDNVTETVSTLRFGERAKRIKTAVVANEKKSQAALQKQVEALLEEIVRLKAYIAELERAVGQGGGASGVDMGELQRTATAAAVGRHGDAGVGELVLLEAKLAEEKEKGKMLEIELRAAQAETQAAEADQPAYIRRAEEAEAKALKAEEDAEQGVSERLAEMERACAARVAKAEEQADGRIAAHVAREAAVSEAKSDSERTAALEQELEAAARKCTEAERRADSADAQVAEFHRKLKETVVKVKSSMEQKEKDAEKSKREAVEVALSNLRREHKAQMLAERQAWEGRVVEPSAEDLARQKEEELARQQEMELARQREEQLESDLEARSAEVARQQLAMSDLMSSVVGLAQDSMRDAEDALQHGDDMLQRNDFRCIDLFQSGMSELQKAKDRNTDGTPDEILTQQVEMEARFTQSLADSRQSQSAFVDAAVERCCFGAAVKLGDDSLGFTAVGMIVTPDNDRSLESYRSRRRAGEQPDETPTVAVRWTHGVEDDAITVEKLILASVAEQVDAVARLCAMGTCCVHNGKTGRISSAVSAENATVEVEWRDATHTMIPSVHLQTATPAQKEAFESEHIMQRREDGVEVTIPGGGLTKAHGIVALEESSDGWQKELWKLGLQSITVCDAQSLSLVYSHQIRVETEAVADWVFYDRTKDHYSLSTNHGVKGLESKEVKYNSADPTVVRVKKSSVGGSVATSKEKEAWGFAGPVAFGVGKVAGHMMHRQHSIATPEGGGSDGMQAAGGGGRASTLVNAGARRAPEGNCRKQKPTLKANWPARWVKLDGKALLFFDKQGDKKPRGSSINDLSGCAVADGIEKFTFDGTYYSITLERRGHASLPDLQDNGCSRFCFKNEPDRDAFSAALRNVAAGREWDAHTAGDL